MCVRQLGSTTIDPTLVNVKPTNVNEVKTQENNIPSTEVKTESEKPTSTEIQRITKDNSSNVGIEKTLSSTSEANVMSFNPTKARAVEKPLSVNAFSIEDEIGFQSVKIDDKDIKDISSNEFKVEYEKFSQPEHALKAALDKATNAAKSHDGIEAIVANYSKDGKVESYSLYKATQADVDKISKLSDEGKYDGKVARFVTPSSILFISYEKNTDIKSSYVHKPQEESKVQTQTTPNPQTNKQEPIIKNEVVFENGKAELVSTKPPVSDSEIVVTRPEQSKVPSYLLNPNLSNASKYALDPNLGKLNTGNIGLGTNGFDFSKPISLTNPPLVLAPEVLDSIQNPFGLCLPSSNLYEPFGYSLFTPFPISLSLPLSSQLNLNDPSSITNNNATPVQTPRVERPSLNIKELTIDSNAAKKHIEEIEKSVNRNFSDLSGTYVNDSKQLFAKSMEKYTDPKYDSLIKDETLKSAVVKLRNGESFSNDEIMGVAKAVKSLPLDKLTPDQLQAVKDFESSFTDFENKMNVLKESSVALDGQLKEQTALLSEMSALVQGTNSDSPSKNVFAMFLNKATIASERKPPNSFEILTNNAILKTSMDIINGKNTINLEQATQLKSKALSFMNDRLKTLTENTRDYETLSQQITALNSVNPENIVKDKDIRLTFYLATTAEFEMNIQNIAKENGPDANKKVAELTRNFFGSYVNNNTLNSIVRSAETKVDTPAETEVMHTESFDGTSKSSLSTKVAAADFSSFSAQNTSVPSSIVDTTRSDASTGAGVLSIVASAAVAAMNDKIEGTPETKEAVIISTNLIQNNIDKINIFNSPAMSLSTSNFSFENSTNSPIGGIDFLSDFKKYLAQPPQTSIRSQFSDALSLNSNFGKISSKLDYNFTNIDKLVNVYSDAIRECNESKNKLGVGAEWILKKGLVYGETLNKTFEKADASREAAAKYEGDDSNATIEKADEMEAALAVIDSQFAELAGAASISNLLKRFRDIIVELDMNISKSRNENSTRVNIDVSHSKRMEEFKHHLKALDRSRAENNKDFRTSKQVVAAMLPKIKDPKDQLAMSSLIDVLSAIYTPKASSIY